MILLSRYESFCCYLASLFPKALTSGLYIYGLYAFIFKLSIPLIGGFRGLIVSLVALWLFAQGLYTYFKIIAVGPGSPVDFADLRFDSHDLEDLGTVEPPSFLLENSVTVKHNGKFRSCAKCSVWKPDRAHHCSSCGKCQLKMDHHCPWFSCCIGFRNHKFFVQFLIITTLYTHYILTFSGYQIWKFFKDESYLDEFMSMHIIALGILGLCMGVSTGIFTGLTLYFLFKNLTTIEYYDFIRYRSNMEIMNDSYYKYSNKPNAKELGNVFDLGWRENWRQVMGKNWKEWCLPIENDVETDEDFKNKGLYYPTNPEVLAQLKANSVLQNRLLQELRQAGSRK